MKMLATAAFLVALLPASSHLGAQIPPAAVAVSPSSPEFDAATIKHHNPNDTNLYSNAAGFMGSVGGRVFFGGPVRMLVQYAYGLQDYQVTGGPEWAASERFEINAVPPDNSPSRKIPIRKAEPTAEQRQMLQALLVQRFGLRFHFETKQGEVYLLTRSSKPLKFVAPENPDYDPRAIVYRRSTGMDGEAIGTNTTIDYLATRLSQYLRLPILNQTGITGSWDFHVDPVDPENQDVQTAVYSVVERLGLKLNRSRGPIQTLVIDHIDHPTLD